MLNTHKVFLFTMLLFLFNHQRVVLGDLPVLGTCRRDNRDELGFALIGHQYATFSADTFGLCFKMCFEERCQSVTYLWDGKECHLNKETKESRPADFVPHPAATYMLNAFRAKKGSMHLVPGLSCKDILDSGDAQGDGGYWIDPTAMDNPFQVFCDMMINGGGWTLVNKFKMIHSKSHKDAAHKSDSYREILPYFATSNHFLLHDGMKELREDMGFKQIRFYCYKKSRGKVLHIMTNDNNKGKKVVDFFTIKNAMPQACGSFTKLPDDTSTLSKRCSDWGFATTDRWGHRSHIDEKRLYTRPITWAYNQYYKSWHPGSKQCDDESGALSVGDSWQIFVR